MSISTSEKNLCVERFFIRPTVNSAVWLLSPWTFSLPDKSFDCTKAVLCKRGVSLRFISEWKSCWYLVNTPWLACWPPDTVFDSGMCQNSRQTKVSRPLLQNTKRWWKCLTQSTIICLCYHQRKTYKSLLPFVNR